MVRSLIDIELPLRGLGFNKLAGCQYPRPGNGIDGLLGSGAKSAANFGAPGEPGRTFGADGGFWCMIDRAFGNGSADLRFGGMSEFADLGISRLLRLKNSGRMLALVLAGADRPRDNEAHLIRYRSMLPHGDALQRLPQFDGNAHTQHLLTSITHRMNMADAV